MSELQRKVESMTQKRAEIKEKIVELSQKRTDYIAKHNSENSQENTLDKLMISALYKQLEGKGFEIQK